MKNTKFFQNHSYYSVLKNSNNMRKLAHLKENNGFFAVFRRGVTFSCFEDNLKEIFEEALDYRYKFQITYLELNLALSNVLPDVVLRKLTDSVIFADLTLREVGHWKACTLLYPIIFNNSWDSWYPSEVSMNSSFLQKIPVSLFTTTCIGCMFYITGRYLIMPYLHIN